MLGPKRITPRQFVRRQRQRRTDSSPGDSDSRQRQIVTSERTRERREAQDSPRDSSRSRRSARSADDRRDRITEEIRRQYGDDVVDSGYRERLAALSDSGLAEVERGLGITYSQPTRREDFQAAREEVARRRSAELRDRQERTEGRRAAAVGRPLSEDAPQSTGLQERATLESDSLSLAPGQKQGQRRAGRRDPRREALRDAREEIGRRAKDLGIEGEAGLENRPAAAVGRTLTDQEAPPDGSGVSAGTLNSLEAKAEPGAGRGRGEDDRPQSAYFRQRRRLREEAQTSLDSGLDSADLPADGERRPAGAVGQTITDAEGPAGGGLTVGAATEEETPADPVSTYNTAQSAYEADVARHNENPTQESYERLVAEQTRLDTLYQAAKSHSESQRAQYAVSLGLPPTASQERIDGETERRQTAYNTQVSDLGLDPETATEQQIDAAVSARHESRVQLLGNVQDVIGTDRETTQRFGVSTGLNANAVLNAVERSGADLSGEERQRLGYLLSSIDRGQGFDIEGGRVQRRDLTQAELSEFFELSKKANLGAVLDDLGSDESRGRRGRSRSQLAMEQQIQRENFEAQRAVQPQQVVPQFSPENIPAPTQPPTAVEGPGGAQVSVTFMPKMGGADSDIAEQERQAQSSDGLSLSEARQKLAETPGFLSDAERAEQERRKRIQERIERGRTSVEDARAANLATVKGWQYEKQIEALRGELALSPDATEEEVLKAAQTRNESLRSDSDDMQTLEANNQQETYRAFTRSIGLPETATQEQVQARIRDLHGPDANRDLSTLEAGNQLESLRTRLALQADATREQIVQAAQTRAESLRSDSGQDLAVLDRNNQLEALGLPSDATPEQIARRIRLRSIAGAVDSDRAADAAEPQQMAYNRFVRDLGLDPRTATPEQVQNAYEQQFRTASLRAGESDARFGDPSGQALIPESAQAANRTAADIAEAAIRRQRQDWIDQNMQNPTGTSPTAGTRTAEDWGRLFDEQIAPGLRRQAKASLDEPAGESREPKRGLFDRASQLVDTGLGSAGRVLDRATNLPQQAGPAGLIQTVVRGAGSASQATAAGVVAPMAYSQMQELSPYQLEELARRGQAYQYDEKTGLYSPQTDASLLPDYDRFRADVAQAAPTGGAVAVGAVKAFTPVGYAADFHRLGTGGKIAGAGLELAGLVPGIGPVAKFQRAGKGWARGVRAAATGYATGPFQAALHPIETAKSGGRLADAWVNPYTIPEAGVELTRTTTRVPVRGLSGADLSDVSAPSVARDTQFYSEAQAAAAKQASDELTEQLIKGERARVQVGDRVIDVSPAPFQKATGPAMFSSGPNVQYWEVSGGSRGFTSVEGESFFAPSYHGRFASGGAFGSTTEPGGIGGAVIIRDPEFLEQIGRSGKTYTPRSGGRPLPRAEVAEIEATLQQPQNYPEVSSTYRLWGDRNVITPPRSEVPETVEKLIAAGQVDEANQLLRTGSFDFGRKQRIAVIDRQPSRTPVYTGEAGAGPDTLRGLAVVDDPDALSAGDLLKVKGQAALENIRRLDPRFKAVRFSDADVADDLVRQADELDAAGDAAEATRLRSRADSIRENLRRGLDDAADEAGRVSGGVRLAGEAVRAQDRQDAGDGRDTGVFDNQDDRRTGVIDAGEDFGAVRREDSGVDPDQGRANRVDERIDDSLIRSTFDVPREAPRSQGAPPTGDLTRVQAPTSDDIARTSSVPPTEDFARTTGQPDLGDPARTSSDLPVEDITRTPTSGDPVRTTTDPPTDDPTRITTTDDPVRTTTDPPTDDPTRITTTDDPVRTPTDTPSTTEITTTTSTTDPPTTTEETDRADPPPDIPPPPERIPTWQATSTTEVPPTRRPPDEDMDDSPERIRDPQPAPRPEGGFPRAVAHRETVEYSYDPDTEQFSARVVSTSEPVVVSWDYSRPTSEERSVGSFSVTPLNDRVDAVREQGQVTIPEEVKTRLQREAAERGGPVSATANLRFEHDLDERSIEVRTDINGQSRSPRARTAARLAALTGRAPTQSVSRDRGERPLSSKFMRALERSNRDSARNGGGGRRGGPNRRRPEKAQSFELPEIEVVVGGGPVR